MKAFLLTFLTVIAGDAFAVEHDIIPGSTITFGRSFEFKNVNGTAQTFEIKGTRVHSGSWDESFESWCTVYVEVSAASTGRIAAGRAYTVMPPPGFGEHPHQRKAQLFLSPKVSIGCERFHRWTDANGDRDSTFGSTFATEELLKKSLSFLKVQRKQNPDEDL